jgi:hypothetical protein
MDVCSGNQLAVLVFWSGDELIAVFGLTKSKYFTSLFGLNKTIMSWNSITYIVNLIYICDCYCPLH